MGTGANKGSLAWAAARGRFLSPVAECGALSATSRSPFAGFVAGIPGNWFKIGTEKPIPSTQRGTARAAVRGVLGCLRPCNSSQPPARSVSPRCRRRHGFVLNGCVSQPLASRADSLLLGNASPLEYGDLFLFLLPPHGAWEKKINYSFPVVFCFVLFRHFSVSKSSESRWGSIPFTPQIPLLHPSPPVNHTARPRRATRNQEPKDKA